MNQFCPTEKYVYRIMTWINAKTSINPTFMILIPEQILTYLEPAYLTGI
jgi:hypothetical protein